MSDSLKRISESIAALKIEIGVGPVDEMKAKAYAVEGHLDILLAQIADEIRRRDRNPQRAGLVVSLANLLERESS